MKKNASLNSWTIAALTLLYIFAAMGFSLSESEVNGCWRAEKIEIQTQFLKNHKAPASDEVFMIVFDSTQFSTAEMQVYQKQQHFLRHVSKDFAKEKSCDNIARRFCCMKLRLIQNPHEKAYADISYLKLGDIKGKFIIVEIVGRD